MNIEQILQVNEAFRLDLARYQSTVIATSTTMAPSQQQQMDFGEMCLTHVSFHEDFYLFILVMKKKKVIDKDYIYYD